MAQKVEKGSYPHFLLPDKLVTPLEKYESHPWPGVPGCVTCMAIVV